MIILKQNLFFLEEVIVFHIYIKTGPPNDVCHTISGPGAKKPCRFPFIFNGVTYDKCTYDSADGNIPWCSTLVDDNQNHVPGGGHYGDCGPNCPLPGRSLSNYKKKHVGQIF